MKSLFAPSLLCMCLFSVLFIISCKNNPEMNKQDETTQVDTNTTIVPAPDGLDISKVAYLDPVDFDKDSKKGGSVIIDMRFPAEFEQSHITEARNINFFDPKFKYQLLELDKDKKYFLYDKNGTNARMGAAFMNFNDFKEVYVLRGGYEEWKAQGMK